MNCVNVKCIYKLKHKIIKINDPKSCHCYFNNACRHEVTKIKVDGCAITIGNKCDYALISPTFPENYVELKGGDVEHAVKQIASTINVLSHCPKTTPKRCFVISTSNPLTTTQMQKFKFIFKKTYNAVLAFGRPGTTYEI